MPSLTATDDAYTPEALAAREAEILGPPQRVRALSLGEIGDETWNLVNDIRSGIGLGPATDLPGFTLTMAQHPELFRRQFELATTLFKGRLPPRERELAVLRIGWLLRAPCEWGEHVDISQRFGVTQDEVERVTQGSGAPGWSEHDAAILRAVEEMLSTQTVSDATWAVLARTWDEQQLIEFSMMVGQYVCLGIVQNALRIRLEQDNRGLTHR